MDTVFVVVLFLPITAMRHTQKVKRCSKNQFLVVRNSIDKDRNSTRGMRMYYEKQREDYDILNIK